ncbi:MAG: hypothetical protein WDA60_18585, partial [Acidimicrobiia bacterium]
SPPLYTMLLAAASWIGMSLETAAKLVGILCYAASAGLVALIAGRLAGPVGAALAPLFLVASADYRLQALSGLEAGFAAVLGLIAIALMLEGLEGWSGIALGLALLDKLDAGMLAVAVVVAFLLIMRKVPWRTIGCAAAVLAPWLVFSLVYFGSVLPYSMTQKVGGTVASPDAPWDRSWIVDMLRTDGSTLVAVLALASLAAVPVLARSSRHRAVALAACVAWPLAHAVVFSVIDLGDQYPWYRTVLYPPMAIAAATILALVVQATSGAARPVTIALVVATAVAAVGLTSDRFGGIGQAIRKVAHGHTVDDYEAFEATRRDAGVYLGTVAREHDVIETCFGWIAYGALDNPIKETCPLSTRDPVAPPRWSVDTSFPGIVEPTVPPGAEVARTFVSTAGAGGQTTVIRLARRAR